MQGMTLASRWREEWLWTRLMTPRVGSLTKKTSKEATSTKWERDHCLRGALISSIEHQSGLSAAAARTTRADDVWEEASGSSLKMLETSLDD